VKSLDDQRGRMRSVREQGEVCVPEQDSALLRKLNQFVLLGDEERNALASLEARQRRVPAGTELVHEHQTKQRVFILQEGWGYCSKLLADGGRQVIDVRVPGDFIGLRSILLRTADHSCTTITDVSVADVPADRMLETFHKVPRLAAAMLWAASRDEAMVVEHLVGIGRRSALARVAHFLVELALRLELVGLSSSQGFVCPLNQYVLADALGLTAIHLNRVLRQLREQQLLTFRGGEIIFHDLARLQQLTLHDRGYLDQPGQRLN
jgi:CRP-like cAMP-binding protein